MKSTLTMAAAAVVALGAANAAVARDNIWIVGSSTVFPFSTAVAEQFGKTTSFKTPKVESTGSGGGIKLFCSGVGVDFPDITNSSRRMKASEFETCGKNGVTDIVEVKIGFDGIVIANAKSGPDFDLTLAEVYKALHAGATAQRWNEINPALPNEPIEVLGPPPTSGTRDAFMELVMHVGCDEAGGSDCSKTQIRTDGKFVESGENDNLIVSKLVANPVAKGIFGYSFLEENSDKVKGSKIAGVEATFDNIASGDYPVSRSMYFYVKKAHVGVVPGIAEYVAEFMSEKAAGEDGYLTAKGLIPLPDDMLADVQSQAKNLSPLRAEDL
jgi:phosphate transport system substrate-binding protein